MNDDELRFEAVPLDAGPAAALEEPVAGALPLLDQNEIVELSIKPSPWFVLIVSIRFVLTTVVVAALAATLLRDRTGFASAYVLPLAVLVVALRLGVASLQWASRVYLLTNRRLMRLAGVVSVRVTECMLARVSRANLELTTLQRLLRVGSIHIAGADGDSQTLVWEHVAGAGEVYAKVVRAIRRAQSGK